MDARSERSTKPQPRPWSWRFRKMQASLQWWPLCSGGLFVWAPQGKESQGGRPRYGRSATGQLGMHQRIHQHAIACTQFLQVSIGLPEMQHPNGRIHQDGRGHQRLSRSALFRRGTSGMNSAVMKV